MKSLIRGLVWAAAVPVLTVAFMSPASAACPAVGTAIYGDYRCSAVSNSSKKNPCLMFVVTSVSGGKAYGNYYKNGYYRWVFQYSGSYSC